MICPVCQGDPDKNTRAFRSEVAKLLDDDADCNPGGRTLYFRDGRRLHLQDHCNSCDEAAVRAFLGWERAVLQATL